MTMFDAIECCNCGVVFGLLRSYDGRRAEDKKTFYCPNGHPQSYCESEADKLRRECDRLKQRLAQKDDTIATAERSAAAYRGQVTRLKKRSAAGLCPCCNRHFTNLERHMASKHKNMDPAEPLRVVEGGKI